MGTQGPSPRITLSDTLDVFDRADVPGTPFTTSEVAEELDCARRTAYDKLETLAERDDLETKKAGARGRVWWRPVAHAGEASGDEESAVDQAQFEELVQEVSDYAIFMLDADGNVRSWNDGAENIKGYDADDVLGEHFSTFYTDAEREAGVPERNLQVAVQEGRVEDEGERVRKDGSTFWANVVITPLHDDDGDLRGFIKVTRDMTERYEYEQRLQREKERFRTLVREVSDYAIFMLDADGNVRSWNEGIKQIKGYDREEILGEHFSTFYTADDREAGVPERNLQVAVQEGRVEDEGERVRKDGSTFWANVVITALHDDDGDLRGFAKVTRDMTERHEYEERLRHQRDELAELDRINTVIRDVDQALVAATTREEVEEAVCERLATPGPYSGAWITEFTGDYETATVRTPGGDVDGLADPTDGVGADADLPAEHRLAAAALRNRTVQSSRHAGDGTDGSWQDSVDDLEALVAIPLVHNDVEYGVLVVSADDESTFDERKVSVLGELGETTSHAIAAIKRKERERALTVLQESTRELLHTESHEEIGDVVVPALTGELGYSDAVVYRFDTNRNVLEPVSSSLSAEASTADSLTLGAGDDSPVWTSFVEGGSGVVDSDADAIPRRGFGGRSEMVVPLGDDGVLAVAAPPEEPFDGNDENLVRLVAATVEAAFERVESQANLRERDSILQEQNQRLQRLNGINTVIREVDKGLVQATTHDEIRNVVCERLTDNDRFRFAWIGEPDDADGAITPRTWGGDERGYLDSVSLASGAVPDEPAARAARTGAVTVVPNVADDLRAAPWRKEAFSREFQSAIGVPLRYGDVTYGILAVYADRPEVFGEMEQSVFAELGQTIANTINAVETKQRLLSDKVVELEFRLTDESASFLSRLADQVGCEIAFDGIVPLTEQNARVYFTARGATSGAIREVLDRSVGVESYEFLASSDDEHLFEAVISGPTIPSMLVEHGASLQNLTVADGVVSVVVDLPSDVDVREFIERFQHRYESAEFVARRERERPARTRDGFRMELEEYLTDRQLEVLKTAYFSGFFASPRKSTGGDIADRLDVSQPTVTEHLRSAQYKILDLLLDDGPAA